MAGEKKKKREEPKMIVDVDDAGLTEKLKGCKHCEIKLMTWK